MSEPTTFMQYADDSYTDVAAAVNTPSRAPMTTSGLTTEHAGSSVLSQALRLSIFADLVSDHAMFTLDPQGQTLSWNAAAERLHGWPAEDALGLHFSRFYERGAVEAGLVDHWLSRAIDDGRFEVRGWQLRQDGSRFWGHIVLSAVRDADGQVLEVVQVTRDLTELRDSQQAMIRAAFSDPLTGLPNLARLRERLDQMLATARREHKQLAVAHLELDRFARISESLGQEASDAVLIEVAERLRPCLRETDCLARVGAGEFVLVMGGVNKLAGVIATLEKVRLAVSDPMQIASNAIVCTASLGLSLYPGDAKDGEQLLRHASSALDSGKVQGHNALGIYKPGLTDESLERLSLEAALHRAIERNEFFLEFQPIFNAQDHTRVTGYEALIRWNRAGGVAYPNAFISVAEETGLIHSIGQWVLMESCLMAAAWPQDIGISVNCSAVQLRSPEFIASVRDALQMSRIEPKRLTLELTESVFLACDVVQTDLINQLKALGVRLSIDDFGVGYSSLHYLRQLAPHSVKVDRSFVADLAQDSRAEAIISATINMAHGLGIQVVAEGVEFPDQLTMLRGLGCDEVQGFLCGRPAQMASPSGSSQTRAATALQYADLTEVTAAIAQATQATPEPDAKRVPDLNTLFGPGIV